VRKARPEGEIGMVELLLAVVAQAEGGGEDASGGGFGLGNPLFMMILMFAVIYFMLIRPQQKRQKEQQTLRDALKRGDKVVTSGGIYGTISGIDDQVVSLEVDKGVRIRILRTQIAGQQPAKQPQPGGGGKGKGSGKGKGR